MRHLKKGRKFGRVRKVRRALIRSLLNSLIKSGKITTTEARAKEIKPLIEKIITRAKTDTVFNRRLVDKNIGANQVKKLFTEIAPRYKERKGGYARIIKLGRRKSGDAAAMAVIEFI